MKLSRIYDTIVLNRTYEHFLTHLRTPFDDVNKAHLVMLSETRILPEETVKKIKEGLIRYDTLRGFPGRKPEEVEDYFFYAEKTLSEFIGETAAGSLHIARSRNDMDTTLFRMAMRENIAAWIHRLIQLLEAMIAHGRRHLVTPIVLFTHGQPAQISSYAHYLGAMVAEMLETVTMQRQAYESVNGCPMGACAITTTGFPIDRHRVASLLGFSKPIANSYQAISTSHWLLVPVQHWILFLNDVTRFVEDMLHKSSFEVGILSYPDDLVQMSSIMPQKRNPVILEHIRIKAGMAMGVFQSFADLFHNTAYQDINENGDLTLDTLQKAVIEMMETIDLFEEAILKARIHAPRVEEIAMRSGITVTELADEIVRRERVAFRDAHHIVSRYVSEGSRYEALKHIFEEKTGRALSMKEETVREVLAPAHFIKIRTALGGPGAMDRAFEQLSQEVKAIGEQAEYERERLQASRRNLLEAFDQL